jgi:hypothetical protein
VCASVSGPAPVLHPDGSVEAKRIGNTCFTDSLCGKDFSLMEKIRLRYVFGKMKSR